MNSNPTRRSYLKPLALALALALALDAGSTQAQTIHVGGDGVIGDTVLTTSGGIASVGVTGASWKVNGGTGAPVSSTLISPAVAVPNAGNVTLTFTHRYNFEAGWDGGAVLISVNGNPAVYLAGSAFSSNGYVGSTTGNSSVAWAGGQNVFYNESAGFSVPALITSVANLGPLSAGDTVSVQFKGEWDQGTTNGPPAWEIGTVKLTDAAATDFVNVNFSTGGSSSFTVENNGTVTGPWVYSLLTATSSFEINGDTLAADRYVPNILGAVIDLSNADIVVKLLAGMIDPGDRFTLFDLSGGTTLTGTPKSISLPPLGVWNTSNLATNGTITFVALPPTRTWNLASGGAWDTETENWTADGGTTTTLYTDGAAVVFDKPEGGVISGVVNRTPFSTTVNSSGNYSFQVSATPGVPSILGGTLTKSGSGILELGDTAWASTANSGTYRNNFTSVQINAGTVKYGSNIALGMGTVTVTGGTTLQKFGQEGNGASVALANAFVLNGEVTMHMAFTGLKDHWFSGQISGAGGIRITGDQRTLTITGNNSFEGGVTMENTVGTLYGLALGHINAMGTGNLTVKTTAVSANSSPFRGFGTTANLSADPGIPNNVVINTGAVFNVGRTQNLRLEGVISGGGRVNKINSATTLILDGASIYTGGTLVPGGTLTINGSLADSTMTISGGTVNGTGTLTSNIDGTTFDQIAMSAGTLTATDLKLAINPTGAGLTQAEYVLVNATGGTITGTFANITGAPGYELNYNTPNQIKLVRTSSPYATWSGGAAANTDTNGDGVANGVAWALGAAGPNAKASGLLPTLDNTSDAAYVSFKFNRSDAANDDTNTAILVEYGSDLVGWTTAVDNDNVDIVVTPGSPNDAVEVKLKRSTLGASGKIFARLKVVVTTP